MIEPLVQRLFAFAGKARVRHDLSTMQRLCEWQNQCQRRFTSIHIAGTNGKGSVALKIATALEASKRRVGLYTSPHISDYRERIQVNGAMISKEFALSFLPKIFAFVDQECLEPTFFELLTILAFAYFAEQKVDVAVLETGLGGEFDATNVALPILSVITSIHYDHTEILGKTLDDIARAKAGIIKEGVPVIVGPKARYAPIMNACHPICVPETPGFYDRENSAIARAALMELNIPEPAIIAGLSCRPPCRFEIIDSRPLICDVAHNPDGFDHLREALDEKYPAMMFQFVLAMGKEKDFSRCVEKISSKAIRIACVSNGHERLASAEKLAGRLQQDGFVTAFPQPSIKDALKSSEPTIVLGSFFIMDSVLRIQNRDGAATRLIHR